ncbi:hypothetical protein HHK36_020219 [Tetracentron sinense]|uniref:Rapid ALkalinization Factor n=1 Tax=Tetracentron sinense TaxID=13715 RepID=A0A834YT90_TETSI|nr:hypothetical protein HHK36_020219 [Tetracentron sinense]
MVIGSKRLSFSFLFTSLLFLQVLITQSSIIAAVQSNKPCNGSIAECLEEEEEQAMESEISRRFLQGYKYINPGALKKDQQICGNNARGVPSTSCLSQPANSPTRGCSKIYGCRHGNGNH